MGSKSRYGEGSVFQRGSDGRWCAKVVITDPKTGKKKDKLLYGKTETEVKRRLREYKNDPLNRSKEFVSDADAARYIRHWLDEYKKPIIKDTTFDRSDRELRQHIESAFSGVRLKDVSSDMCKSFILALKDGGLRYSTVKKDFDILKSCFSFALDSQDIQRNPMSTVKMPKKELFQSEEPEDKEHHLTEAQERKFLTEIGRTYKTGKYVYRYRCAFILALNTGMRMGEIVALDWKDIDLIERTIYVHKTAALIDKRDKTGKKIGGQEQVIHETPKTKKSVRTIPANNKAMDALMELKKQAGNSPYLLPTQTGKRVVINSLEKSCKIALGRVDDEKEPTPHWLRHTFATRLFEKGADVKDVSALLGHSSVAITYNTYIHVIESRKIDTVSLLDDDDGDQSEN